MDDSIVFLNIMLLSFTIWTVMNAQGLQEINRLSIFIAAIIAIFLVSNLGSYRIWNLLKEGKV